MAAMKISAATIQWLIDRYSNKDLSRPYVIRTSRSTAVKLAEAFGVSWLHESKGKQQVGPFLIIA